MAENVCCPGCGQELPANTPHGLCPECLLRQGMESESDRSPEQGDTSPTAARSDETQVGSRPILEGPGSRIGPYKLLQQIGEGGMGVVYMAEQEKPVRRRVALKIIKPGMDTAQVIARFEAERQALALMDHQHIAKVFEAGATETGRPYFVMELVRGVPITEYCDRNQLTPKERLELFVPVCNAIQHAHQNGIIHRDIKPSNVLVMIYDGKRVAKLIDFGVAKATDQRLTERTMFTEFGQVVGTLEYMSPEQAEMGSLDIDSRSDIYSLGVVLYELLTGSTPLERVKLRQAAYMEILRRIREDETTKPSTRLSDSKDTLAAISTQRKTEPARLARLVRGELDWIVMRALEKDRVRRYDTASAFARDIQRYLSGDPVEAGPPSAAYRLRKLARKYRPWLATAAAFAALLLGATGIYGLQARRVEQAERLLAERNRVIPKSAPAPAPPASAAPAIDSLEVARRLKEATVYIRNKINHKTTLAYGSGFVIEARGGTVMVASNRRLVDIDLSEIPARFRLKDSNQEIEVVFRSAQGKEEESHPARIIAADSSGEFGWDLAFLLVEGVRRPPTPLDINTKSDTVEGMGYMTGGIELGAIVAKGNPLKGNPGVTITGGLISGLVTDDHGLLDLFQVDRSMQPRNSGWPVVEEKTGKFIGVVVAKVGSVDTLGYVVPAAQVRLRWKVAWARSSSRSRISNPIARAFKSKRRSSIPGRT